MFQGDFQEYLSDIGFEVKDLPLEVVTYCDSNRKQALKKTLT